MKRDALSQALDIRAVVLVGRLDFGRCPLAAHLPAALWPVAGKPALVRLLEHLASEGVQRVVVCGEADVLEHVPLMGDGSALDVTLLTEDLTGGTAGCLRDAAGSDPGDLVLLFSGSMASPPPLATLIEAHLDSGADLTMVFNPGRPNETAHGSPAEIYLCKPDMLRLIPRGGYSDVKEGLIPSILSAGGTVRPLVLPTSVGGFHDHKGYLKASSAYLMDQTSEVRSGLFREDGTEPSEGTIHSSARIRGPVMIGEQARILDDAVVIGPAIIGRQSVVGRGSTVVRSVLWDNAEVGVQSRVLESVIDSHAKVPAGTSIARQAFSARGDEAKSYRAGGGVKRKGNPIGCWRERAAASWGTAREKWPLRVSLTSRYMVYGLGAAAILAAFLWCYWPTFLNLRAVWRRSDEYSAGLLVPFLAAYVLWSRRRDLGEISLRPAVIGGIVLFLIAQALRGVGLLFLYRSGERLSIVISVAAAVLLVCGWRLLGKVVPVLLFLCLMLPWPNRVQSAITLPLQRWATTSAVFSLELAGYDVLQDGNIIKIGDTSVAVAEACNGLRMITAFFVISGLVVLLARRAWWEKLLVLISSLPIALLCNTLRLTITAIFFTSCKTEEVEKLFHDFGGYAMMPLALGMVVGELWLLARLTTPPTQVAPAVISRRRPRHVPDS